MNLDLEKRLASDQIPNIRLKKAEKVKLLRRWTNSFPNLLGAARRGETHDGVHQDRFADGSYDDLPPCDFYILPDDDSGMPACFCSSAKPPALSQLVSDTFTNCEELVIVAANFGWSAVFVNHGCEGPASFFQWAHRDVSHTIGSD